MTSALLIGIAMLSQISADSLLNERDDLMRLTQPANYQYLQCSSWDRRSQSSADEDWFANDDWGKYVRSEQVGSRTEFVMMEAEGPGAIMRVWSANPEGTIRIYIDGSNTPEIECRFLDFFKTGVIQSDNGLCYESAKGFNLYAPIPFSRSMKVTISGPGAIDRLYYQIGYRKYSNLSSIRSFSQSIDGPILNSWRQKPNDKKGQIAYDRLLIQENGAPVVFKGNGRGTVSQLNFVAEKLSGTWRDVRFKVKVDDEVTIDSNIGDFFGLPAGAKSFESQVASAKVITSDGKIDGQEFVEYQFLLPMPFEDSVSFEFSGKAQYRMRLEAPIILGGAKQPLKLYAQNHYYSGGTRPFRDMRFLETQGRGRFVGSVLSVENPVAAWWGEGDEKVFVDNEKSPSIFGTGTEDYFGYAWCWPEVFSKPFHGQPRVDGPGNYGHTSNYRWQTWDDIPFRSSLIFDMEMWHWADTDARFSTTAFWYGESHQWPVSVRSVPEVRDLPGAKRLDGVIEGEDMRIVEVTGGVAEKQGGFLEISGGEQLWWKNSTIDSQLLLEFLVAKPGRYRIEAHLCTATDYGIHELMINSKASDTIDFYRSELGWRTFELGIHDFNSGKNSIRIRNKGKNGAAIEGSMFGLDYLRLIPVADPKMK